jgi:putative addiction module CopG family antidote
MDAVILTPELEQFAAEAVAAGRYRDIAEVVRAGVSLVRRLEADRAAFIASLESAEAGADRDGSLSLDDVLEDMDRIIAAAERHSA